MYPSDFRLQLSRVFQPSLLTRLTGLLCHYLKKQLLVPWAFAAQPVVRMTKHKNFLWGSGDGNIFQIHLFREPHSVRAGLVTPWGKLFAEHPAQHQGQGLQMFPFFLLTTLWLSRHHFGLASICTEFHLPTGTAPKPRSRCLPENQGTCIWRPSTGWMSPDLLYLKAASILSPPWTREDHSWLIRKQLWAANFHLRVHSGEFAIWSRVIIFS